MPLTDMLDKPDVAMEGAIRARERCVAQYGVATSRQAWLSRLETLGPG